MHKAVIIGVGPSDLAKQRQPGGVRSQRPDHESQKRHRRSGIWQVNIYWS